MIKKIITRSRNTDVHALTLLIMEAYQMSGITGDERLTAIIAKLKLLVTELGFAIHRKKTESNLKEQNYKRTTTIRSFYHVLVSFTLRSDAVIKTAADKALHAFNKYGLNMVKHGYRNETSLTNSLLDDLSTDEMAENMALLYPLNKILKQIQAAQTEFTENQLAYEKAKAKEGDNSNASELKTKVIKCVNNLLLSNLFVSYELYNNTHGEFVMVINQLITDNNSKVKKRLRNTEDTENEE